MILVADVGEVPRVCGKFPDPSNIMFKDIQTRITAQRVKVWLVDLRKVYEYWLAPYWVPRID